MVECIFLLLIFHSKFQFTWRIPNGVLYSVFSDLVLFRILFEAGRYIYLPKGKQKKKTKLWKQKFISLKLEPNEKKEKKKLCWMLLMERACHCAINTRQREIKATTCQQHCLVCSNVVRSGAHSTLFISLFLICEEIFLKFTILFYMPWRLMHGLRGRQWSARPTGPGARSHAPFTCPSSTSMDVGTNLFIWVNWLSFFFHMGGVYNRASQCTSLLHRTT